MYTMTMEPSTRPEVYQEMFNRCRLAIKLRWVGAGVIFAVAAVLSAFVGYSLITSIFIAAFVGSYNLIGYLSLNELKNRNWSLAPRGPKRLLDTLLVLDLLTIAVSIWVSGGSTSHFLPAYLVFLPLASLALPRTQTAILSLVAVGLLNLVIWLPYFGILPPVFLTSGVHNLLVSNLAYAMQQSLYHSLFIILAVLTAQVGIHQNQILLAIQQKLTEQTEVKARTDELTRLYNRRHFMHVLEEQVAIWICDRKPFSVLMTDLDHYKEYNDQYGHLAGDNALRELSDVVRSILRLEDMAFRYGGDELAIILPSTSLHEAAAVGERVRRAVAAHVFVTPDGDNAKITMSIGVAAFPTDGRTIDQIISRADKALFFAKEERNAIRIAEDQAGWYIPKRI